MTDEEMNKDPGDGLGDIDEDQMLAAILLTVSTRLKEPHSLGMDAALEILNKLEDDEKITKAGGGMVAAIHGVITAAVGLAASSAPSERMSRALVESAVRCAYRGIADSKAEIEAAVSKAEAEEGKEKKSQGRTYRARYEW